MRGDCWLWNAGTRSIPCGEDAASLMPDVESVAHAHRELVRVAVATHGARGIADRVASSVGGWVLLLDEHGALRASVPATARAHLPRIQTELTRFGAANPLSTLTVSMPGEFVAIRPVVTAGRARGFLAIGRPEPLDPIERSLVDTATYLMAEDLRRTDESRQAARNDRRAVLQLMLDGDVERARRPAATLGVPVPDGPMRVALLGVPRNHGPELLETAEEDQALRRLVTLIAELRPGRVAILLPTAEGDTRTLEAILRRVPHGRGAVSDATDATELPAAWARVRSVFRAALDEPGRLYEARDVTDAGLLRYLDGPDAKAWADATLAGLMMLDRGSKVDFIQTLRTFLANNGRADASASALDIHRHTLRYRMSQLATALDRDLDDPTVRAELWIALQLGHE